MVQRMFDEKIKNTFDKLSPSSDQKRRMLGLILSSKQKEKIHMMRYIGVLSSCAAVLLIAVSIYSANHFLEFINQNAKETTVIDNTVVQQKKAIGNEESVTVKKDTEKQSEIVQNPVFSEEIAPDNHEDTSETASYDSYNSTLVTKGCALTSDTPVAAYDNTQNEACFNDELSRDFVFLYNDLSLFHEEKPEAFSLKEDADDDVTVLSDETEYNFFDSIVLPDDFYEEKSENPDIGPKKSNIFNYVGKDGRSVEIIISDYSQDYNSYITNPDIIKTEIYDSSIVLFSDDGMFVCCLLKDNYQYKVITDKLTETEFENLITSII